MPRGKFFGVSVGPGDPELLTLKAVRVLREADVIAAPVTGGSKRTALGIVESYVEEKRILDCPVPMSKDRSAAMRAYRESADRICRLLDRGLSVAFVTLGDASVYSTFFYLEHMVADRGYQTEVVPGVTSFSASAARLGIPLCEGAESLHVIPGGACDLDAVSELPGTLVFLKSGRALPELRAALLDRGKLERASLVVDCGLDDERVYGRLADAPEDLDAYFAVVIVRP